MKRNAGALVLVAALGGCMSMDRSMDREARQAMGPGCPGQYGIVRPPPTVPGVQAGWGQPLAMAQPYATTPPNNNYLAYQMMARSVPMNMVQASNPSYANTAPGSGVVQASANFPQGACGPGGCMPSGLTPDGGLIAPPGAPFAPGMQAPGQIMQTSGMPSLAPRCPPPSGAVAAVGALAGGAPPQFPVKRTQVRVVKPSGMKVAWLASGPDGRPTYSPTVLEAPGRYNFLQAAIYRLKLSNIEGRPGLEVYPTLEVVPANPKTDAFLAHSAVPLEFTNEDFDQIAAGNYVVKVIYLPDPQFQEVAATGIEEISSTRLEPGADPIVEALRRGSILLVIRMGNMDQEAPNTPAIDAPAHGMMLGAGMGQGMAGPGPIGPYGMGAPGPMALPPAGAMEMSAPAHLTSAPVSGPVSLNKLPDASPIQPASALLPPPAAPPAVSMPPVPTPAALAAQYNGAPR